MYIVDDENRGCQRNSVPLPVRVAVSFSNKVGWYEVTRLKDISPVGAGFRLKRPVRRGQLILLTLSMPRQLRRYDLNSKEYNIWGIVRRCIKIDNIGDEPHYAVGVAFIGKTLPEFCLRNQSRLFEISDAKPKGDGFWSISNDDLVDDVGDWEDHSKRPTRLRISEEIKLELMDDDSQTSAFENTVTENISPRGAAVFSELTAEVGSFLRVTSSRHNITLISMVRGKRIGADGLCRLHLEFIDEIFPIEGLNP